MSNAGRIIMGLLNTIINLKNLVTGGSADVVVDVEPALRGVPFNITVQVLVAAEELQIEGAYLQIQGIEEIEVPQQYVDKQTPNKSKRASKKEIIRRHTITSEQKIQIAQEMDLEANEAYKWDAVAKLAPNNEPVYKGKHCNHYYRIRAYLDCYGNDPDSGWIDLQIA